jgi:hypothetical protein
MPDRRIQYLSSQDVDREKWDRCVAAAPNSLIYNSSIYLDMMADHWNAVVVGDYEAVMPLPWRRRWFVKYHYHVPFIAQGGLTGTFDNGLSKTVAKAILRKISYGDLVLNHGNQALAKFMRAVPLVNLVLDLAVEFPHIFKMYHHNLDKNLRRASRFELVYKSDYNVKLPIALFRKEYGSRLKSVRPVDYERFTGLCLHLYQVNKAIVRKVTDEKGKPLATALLLRDHARLYNVINTVSPEGKRRSANHFLFDQLIREFAGQPLVLDFESTQQAGVRKFYEHYGAVSETYYWSSRMPF